MPIVFIHGVNTRAGSEYNYDLSVRNELIKRIALEPPRKRKATFRGMEIYSPYWGDVAASFRWNMESFPKLSALAALGPSDSPADDPTEFVEAVEQIASPSDRELTVLKPDAPGLLKRAATKDLVKFVEAILLPLIRSEQRIQYADTSNDLLGVTEAHLLIAADDISRDPKVI